MSDYKYRLQIKEQTVRPNILGNCSFPVYTTRWRDIATSSCIEPLKALVKDGMEYRIIDTENNDKEV